jgi:hypothetical protein
LIELLWIVADGRVVLWAQRSSETDEGKNIVYLSVNAIDLQHPKVDLTASSVTVEGVQKGTEATYKVSLEFYEDINVEVPKPAPLQFLFPLEPSCILDLTLLLDTLRIPCLTTFSLCPMLDLCPRRF